MLTSLIIIVLLICTIIQSYYWIKLFGPLAKYQDLPTNNTIDAPVSIIICARNEAHNLQTFLPKILTQNYAEYEVIVVNDCSDDGTKQVLQTLTEVYPHLRIVNLETKLTPGKKGALEEGIKAAKHDWLLLTDADCVPKSDLWINRMMTPTKDKKIKIVLGFSPYRYERGLLNLFIQYETFLTATQYLSYALAGIPYMGVGRNLLYHRTLFEAAGGFQSHKNVTSGDDDLLISKIATSHNTAISISSDSQTISAPSNKYAIYYKQKRRHLSTGGLYKNKTKILISVFTLSHCFIYLCFVIYIVFKISTMFVPLLYVTRLIVLFPMTYSINKRLHTHTQLVWLPLLDLLLPMYIVFMSHALILNSHRWK